MHRLIKRYESRKLYDTEESRYVSLDELAEWIRVGKNVKVVDNGTGADVTAQMLTQIILEEGRRGTGFLPTELLHELADSAYFGGTVLVASAHNMPVESYPWRFSSVISVGSDE